MKNLVKLLEKRIASEKKFIEENYKFPMHLTSIYKGEIKAYQEILEYINGDAKHRREELRRNY